MNELLDSLLRGKLETRRRLANLSIEEKLFLMERMRDRARLIAASPLRMGYHHAATVPQVEMVVVSGDGVVLSVLGAQKMAWMPLGVHGCDLLHCCRLCGRVAT